MTLPGFKKGLPRGPFLFGAPVAAFLVAVAFVLATSGGESETATATPTIAVSVAQSQVLPTATPIPPTATVLPDRTSCGEIQGTAYRSDAERDWYQRNCASRPSTAATGGSTGTAARAVSQPAVSSGGGGQPAMGEYISIPKAGLNRTPINEIRVGPDGDMAAPTGYFNLGWYNFEYHPGLGGHPTTGGNTVLAGHVDSAIYGQAVLYYLREVVAGDVIEYWARDGSYHRYVVTAVGDYLPSDNWSAIVASGTADLTIITCTGVFDTSRREYTHRKVVFARRA